MIKWHIVGFIFLLYLIATGILYFFSDWVIFPALQASYQDNKLHPLKLITGDGKKISALFLENKNAKDTVLFSHGNGEDLGDILPYLKKYQSQGFSIFAYDYHGYGSSEGRPSETNTYLDVQAAYEYLSNTLKIADDHIILHGRSLGSGPTLELATKIKAKAVILESPLLTAFRVLTIWPLFPIDKFRNDLKIVKVKSPILIIHGTLDEVIPFWHGAKLYSLANGNKKLYEIKTGRHNDLILVAPTAYWSTIQDFVQAL